MSRSQSFHPPLKSKPQGEDDEAGGRIFQSLLDFLGVVLVNAHNQIGQDARALSRLRFPLDLV